MARVELELLGRFRATVDGIEVPRSAWRLRKARDLVKLLALAPGHRLHREQAMEALWPGRSPASAANNLYQAVHAARHALGRDSVVVQDELVSLAPGVEVDVDTAVAAARSGARRHALALLEEELLPENRYDDWAEARREELAELATDLRAADAAFAWMLPAATSSFVGRDDELADLRSLLARARLVTLTGPGGAGKTRLALELAREASADARDGAAFVELAPVVAPAGVGDAFLRTLGAAALRDVPAVVALHDLLGPRSILLVVDNCEHVLAAARAIIESVLQAAPEASIVATSREPLRIPGEVVFRVPSLRIPDAEHVPPVAALARYPSVRLFVERAAAASPGFALAEENAADVARICARLDGLPLALELAAGRLGALTPAAMAERLDDRFRLLRAGAGSETAPTRQQTLAATIQWSHDLLETEERILFRRLAAFSGGFSLEATEAVCADADFPRSNVADVLARLVEKSLVSADGGRYTLLESVRLYAHDELERSGEDREIARRHAAWAFALAESATGSRELDPDAANIRVAVETLLARAPDDALRMCVALRPFWLRRLDLREASERLDAALEHASPQAPARTDALLAAAQLAARGGELDRALARASEALESALETGDTPVLLRTLQFLGEYDLTYARDRRSAIAWFEQAVATAEGAGLVPELALGTYSLGVARWMLGDADGATAVEESAKALAGLGDKGSPISAPINIGEIRSPDGSSLGVVLEETLMPFIEVPVAAARGLMLANMSVIARVDGDFDRALLLLAESEGTLRDPAGRAAVLVRRGHLERARGNVGAARRALTEALALRRELDDRRGAGLALGGLALVEIDAGALDVASALVAEAHEIFVRAGDRWGLVNTLWRMANVAVARGDHDAAETALAEARRLVLETNLERWAAHAVAATAEVAALRGDRTRARALFEEAAELYAAAFDDAGGASARRHARSFGSRAKAVQRAGR